MPCSGFKWVEVARGVLLLTGDRLGINQQMMSNCTVHHLGFIFKNSISNYHDFKKLFQLFNCSYPNPEGFLWFSSPSHRGGDRGVSYCLEDLCSSSAKLLQHKQNWRQKAVCPMGWEGVVIWKGLKYTEEWKGQKEDITGGGCMNRSEKYNISG